jgi:hypothetical protein
MSSRDFAVVALGRFLVVERYRERCPSPSTDQLPGPARTGAAGTPASGTRAARSGCRLGGAGRGAMTSVAASGLLGAGTRARPDHGR